jgi:Fur family peroxide stress response transcriptional regulator
MKSKKTAGDAAAGGPPGKELAGSLRAHRFRLTPQRAAVYRAVCGLGHASPRQIHEVVRQTHPMVSLNTVYATLETLERVGQILRLKGPEGSLLYEATRPSHHHFHCFSCGRVLDILDPGLDDIPLPPTSSGQFSVTRRRVEFYGYCPRCPRPLHPGSPGRQGPADRGRRGRASGPGTSPPRRRARRPGTRRR